MVAKRSHTTLISIIAEEINRHEFYHHATM